jgi:DNA-binding protein HU-beta
MLNVCARAREKSLASKKLCARALCSGFDLDTMRPPSHASSAKYRCESMFEGNAFEKSPSSGPLWHRRNVMRSVVTKSDLVRVVAKSGNLSKVAAGEAVNAMFDAIVSNVAKGNRVTVVGFGTFMPRKRKARNGRNPGNGKEIKIHAKTIPAFAAGQGFKDAVDRR